MLILINKNILLSGYLTVDFVGFSYDGYRMRNQLAAIDYNEHLDRPYAINKDGTARYVVIVFSVII